jgi:hypothetical protein
MSRVKSAYDQPKRFSAEWWWAGVRNFFFVAVVALLIWIYADNDVTEDKDFRATVALTNSDPNAMVLLSERRIEVFFELRGTRSALAIFQRELEEVGGEVLYDVARGYAPGEHDIRTADLLNTAAGLSRQGLTVLAATPTQINFVLDRRVQRQARVELDATGATLSGEAAIKPRTISVSIAQSDLDELRLGPDEPIVLKTRRLDLRSIPAGEPQTIQLEILPPAGVRQPVQLSSRSAEVTLQVDERTEQKTFRVAVQLLFPHTWAEDQTWEQYELVKKDPLEWQADITITGSKKDVESLRQEEIEAYVTLGESDKQSAGAGVTMPPRTVTVRFPADKDVSLVGPPPVVHFKLQRRTPTAASTTTP